ncbi:MAG TPA: DUF4230 domain-containing protein [Acidimicrobiales bacterium]|nr:DUF4230 domain-containing protein [Acidimicrobiales bacterium]
MTNLVGEPARKRTASRVLLSLVMVVLGVMGLDRIRDALPSLGNPFSSHTVDRSGPAVLHALEDVSLYNAATANYSVIIDSEKDTRWVPSVISGERAVFVAAGSVPASVDFSALGADNVVVTDERVVVSLPAVRLGQARIDPGASRVVSRDRGLLNRLGSVFSDTPTSEKPLYLEAQRRLSAAAKADPALSSRARANTTRMLRELLAPLGFTQVQVRFTR